MGKTGVELPELPKTGVDANLEQVKAHLAFHSEANKTSAEVKQKCVEHLFSANFLVFIVTIVVLVSGFVFMNKDGTTVEHVITYWQLILPIITTYIGYAIGKGKVK
ncbi:TPA: hypothetical protein P0E30_005100 [Vibrio harveyi]|nr:hypothetical protein [Vibrio harveyi]